MFQINEGLTLTPGNNLVYCTTFNKELGDALKKPADEIFYENLEYKKQIFFEKCPLCSHWMTSFNRQGFFQYMKELFNCWKIFH
jgi:hypothetical protein